MNRLKPIGVRNALILVAGAGLLTGPWHLAFACACLLLALAALLAPAPGPSLGRAWRYACDRHPVPVALAGVVLALSAAALAWTALLGPFILLAEAFA